MFSGIWRKAKKKNMKKERKFGLKEFPRPLILNIGGYVGTAATQTAGAIMSIKAAYIYVPILLTAVQFVILLFYKLDKEYPAILADLQKRRGREMV